MINKDGENKGDDDSKKCPSCGSSNIDGGAIWNWCLDCGYRWEKNPSDN